MSSQQSAPGRLQSERAGTAASAEGTFFPSDVVNRDEQGGDSQKVPSSRSAPGIRGALHGPIQAYPDLKTSYPVSIRSHPSSLAPMHTPSLETSFQREVTSMRLSRSVPGIRGSLYGPIHADHEVTNSSPKSTRHSRSRFAPMDPTSLDASIKKEESWLSRRHSPRRGMLHRIKTTNDLIKSLPSHDFNPDDAENIASQNECSIFSNEVDDFEFSSDEEKPSSYLLGVSTPSTLRKKRLRTSLPTVHEGKVVDTGSKSPPGKQSNQKRVT